MREWKSAPLGELADAKLGKMLDQKKNAGEYRRYLGNDNVQWGYFKLDDVKEMKIKESEFERFSVRRGDLLVCEGGDPGRCALWDSGEEITLSANGEDEEAAMSSIEKYLSNQ